MKKPNFLAGSVLFHLVITFILLIMPPPYPKPPFGDSGDYTPVVLTKATSRNVPDFGEGTVPALSGDGTVMFSGKGPAASDDKPEPAPGDTAAPSQTTQDSSSQSDPPARDGEQGEVDGQTGNPDDPAPEQAQPPAAQQAEAVAPVAVPPPADGADAAKEPPVTAPDGVTTDRTAIDFKYQRGWPVPGMVRVKVRIKGLGRWHAEGDEDWIIISRGEGEASGEFSVGVDTSRLALGFYEGTVGVLPKLRGGSGGDCEIPVSLMVLPEDKARPELPHTSWDRYMSGDCKVCHLPKELLPSGDFMVQPEFCGLCHNKAGMAAARLVDGAGHPMLVEAGSRGTKMPTYGTVANGPKSNRMAGHLKDGRLVVCVTCHNVMEKPGDYGRAWEMTTTDDWRTYRLYMGGWAGMGHIEPRVYVTEGLLPRPMMLKSARGYLAQPSGYTYDEAEGTVRFKAALKPGANVYVTLGSPYLRVTTEDNRLCYDCHSENTHRGLNCLDCHVVHGTGNIKAVRQRVRTPDRASRKVSFRARDGKNSFADDDSVYDGICEVCHTKTKHHRRGAGSNVHADGMDYSGTDCTRCHRHSDGFSM